MNSTNVFITIDTEWDRTTNKTDPIAVKNLSKIPLFQELCDKYNINPIYFCTYEVLNDTTFIAYLSDRVKKYKVEIGAHLHPWSNPPFPYGDPIEERKHTSFPHEYPLEIFYKKLRTLTKTIKKQFNISPISYRAGRFGFIKEHIPYLEQLGYKVDSSITPYISHTNVTGWKTKGRDFSTYTTLSPQTLTYKDSSILEIPLTIISLESIFGKIINKILRKKRRQFWFRIYPKTELSDLLKIISYVQAKHIDTLVFMIHSNEFHPNTNPYFTTPKQQQKLFQLLEAFFQKLEELYTCSLTFRDFINKDYRY